jgi:hypothetical protein
VSHSTNLGIASVPVSINDPLCGARPFLREVLEMTQQIFSFEATYVEVEDWEIANLWQFSIECEDRGPMQSILERHQRWHRRLATLPSPARMMFCLDLKISQ